jgi:hypothetical protein
MVGGINLYCMTTEQRRDQLYITVTIHKGGTSMRENFYIGFGILALQEVLQEIESTPC